MAELKTHSNFESVLNPDDKKLSEEYNKNRIQTVADLAEARVYEVSGGRNWRKEGGFVDFFADLENRSVLNPYLWTSQVRNRVFSILSDVNIDMINTNNGSSSSVLESSLWRRAGWTTLKGIEKVRQGTITSLSVIQGYKTALDKAKAGVFEQFEETKNRQAEIIANRSWWRKLGPRILKVATLGGYSLIERKKRQKWFNARLEKRLNVMFNELNRNIQKMEKIAELRKQKMKKHLERVVKGTPDIEEKAKLKKQLLDAIQQNGEDIDLSAWRNFNGGLGIIDGQEIIDFLEAAKELDFVKNDLAAIGISKQKNKEQREMIESAQAQQEIMTDLNNFKAFEEIKKKTEFKNFAGKPENALSISQLVRKIENQLQGQGIDVEKEIYTSGSVNLKRSDLMVDSTRLVLLINAINTNSNVLSAVNKSIKIKQAILDWIAKQNLESAAQKEVFDAEKTQETFEELKGKNQTGGLLNSVIKLVKKSRNLKAGNPNDIKKFKTSIQNLSAKISSKHAKFETYHELKFFTESDYKLLKEIWEKVIEARDFLEKNIENWEKQAEKIKKQQDKKEENTNYRLKDIKKEIEKLRGDKDFESINYWRKLYAESLKEQDISEFQKKIIEEVKNDIEKHEEFLDKARESLDSVIKNKSGKYVINEAQRNVENLERRITNLNDFINKLRIDGGKSYKEEIREELSRREQRLEELEKRREEIMNEEISDFQNTEEATSLLNNLLEKQGMDHKLLLNSTKEMENLSLAERLQNEFSTEIFKEEINTKFLKEVAKNDQYKTLQTVSEGTTVSLTYKRVGGSSEINFPNQLNASQIDNFIVFRKTDKAVHLLNKDTNEMITIVGPATDSEGKTAYKNAIIRQAEGDYSVQNPMVGGAGEHAIVYNMKISV